jgi:hypothetical protein
LYARGWGLSWILPNGNGIAALRRQFMFANAAALEGFLADLNKYEEKKLGPFSHSVQLRFVRSTPVRLPI